MNRINALLSIAVINSMYILLAFGAYYVHRNAGDNGFSMTLIVGVFGVFCGWLLGTLSSPADAGESEVFMKYSGLISAFLTGYLFTRIDDVIADITGSILTNHIYGLRVLIFASCLISGILIMYILRAYLRGQDSV